MWSGVEVRKLHFNHTLRGFWYVTTLWDKLHHRWVRKKQPSPHRAWCWDIASKWPTLTAIVLLASKGRFIWGHVYPLDMTSNKLTITRRAATQWLWCVPTASHQTKTLPTISAVGNLFSAFPKLATNSFRNFKLVGDAQGHSEKYPKELEKRRQSCPSVLEFQG